MAPRGRSPALATLLAAGCALGAAPNATPSTSPSASPSLPPTPGGDEPSSSPSQSPAAGAPPTGNPSSGPSAGPSGSPSASPAAPGGAGSPTAAPAAPSANATPSVSPTAGPTRSPAPPGAPGPTAAPEAPHAAAHPTAAPSAAPLRPGSPTASPMQPGNRLQDPCPELANESTCANATGCKWDAAKKCVHTDPCFLKTKEACVACHWQSGSCQAMHSEPSGHGHGRRARALQRRARANARAEARAARALDHGEPHNDTQNDTGSHDGEHAGSGEHGEAGHEYCAVGEPYCAECEWSELRQSCLLHPHAASHHEEEESHEAEAIDLFIMAVVIIFAFAAVRGVQVWNWSGMSESAGVILVGIAIGGIVELLDMAFAHEGRYKEQIAFDEEAFAYFILPPIIFEAGYTLQHGGIMRNIGTILTYAVIGTLISTMTIGLLVWSISSFCFEELHDLHGAPFASIAFGALLSAVDPVAVIAVLSSKFDLSGEPPLLYNLVFGESVLNDAVSIVVFNVMYDFVDKEMTLGSFFLAIATFLKVSVLSCIIGWGVGALSALFLKHLNFRHHPPVEVIVLMVFAMASYYFAEAFHLSGIMAIFLCARIMGHHSWHNLSEYSKTHTVYIFKTLAHLAETAVFVLLGLAFWTSSHDFRPVFATLVFLIMLFSRALNIFPLSWIANRNRKKKSARNGHDGPVTIQMQTFMWFGGLRGAIAFGLALIVHDRAKSYDGDEPEKQINEDIATVFVSTTLLMVCVTVIILGGFTEAVLTKLGLIGKEKAPKEEEMLSDDDREKAAEHLDDFTQTSRAIMRRIARWESRRVGPCLRIVQRPANLEVDPDSPWSPPGMAAAMPQQTLGQGFYDPPRRLSQPPEGGGGMDMAE
eukprot:TRINITY_DN11288_c0_g2_i1.p1 TRINITY_DN11288_c0_g2~~TRINITY_DN11288_c0_g2_i1.p1  ORF type:complete len:901 (+),score=326.45 TRINITY_DN11288_c0_g2_i1:81-2705(+)